MKKSFFATQLFDGLSIHQNVRMDVDGAYITQLQPNASYQKGNDTFIEGLVSAGYIDIQVNGGGGVLFNHEQSASSLERIYYGHAKYGTSSMLPTLITDNLQKMQRAADAISECIDNANTGIIGIHFEGPHLSVDKKGIHAQSHIRQISDDEIAILTRKDIGKTLVTLAPETVPPDVIRDLVKNGVCVSLGHSNADLETVLSAVDAGAKCTTHLYNAMSGLTARMPGLIAAALVDKRLYSGLIVDLQHVHAYNCLLAYNNIGAERVMLVTDAMAHVGSDIKTMPWLDSQITKKGNRLSLEDGSIAGSCLNMQQAVLNMYKLLSARLTCESLASESLASESLSKASSQNILCDVLNMASQSSASMLNMKELGSLAVGKRADFVVLNDSLSLQATYLKGERLNDS